MYCEPGTYQSYGYDYSSHFIQTILASDEFMIPTKKGKPVLLKEVGRITEKLQVGYYHVKSAMCQ